MRIICWGSRGSIPVSGREYLKYGGNTTCLEVRTKNDEVIIIDAGSGIRKLGRKLLEENRTRFSLILTHAHWDHIIGCPYFRPLYSEETHVSVYGCPFAQNSIKAMLAKSMGPPSFPVNFEDLKATMEYNCSCSDAFTIDSVTITPIHLSHPNQGIGYKLTEDDKTFVFLTDNELAYKHPGGLDLQDYLEFSRDADLLIHDAEYTREEYAMTRTWGHSVYNDVLQMALDAGVKQLGLFHHNQDRDDDAVDAIVEDCRRIIRESGAALECFAVHEEHHIII